MATVAKQEYTVGGLASAMSGPAMAVAIGYALHCPPLVLFSLITVGFASNALGGAGGPLAVLFVAIFAAECGKAVSKETKVDLLVTPLVTIAVGIGLSAWWAPALGPAAMKVGDLIMWATELQPFLMGILVSLFVGIALTLPISSAAICAALSLTGLAGGAAVAGCCAQMVGFAVMSFRENSWGGLVSQGIGTSMLQMGNIVKNPRIWIAPTLTSAITGPIATCLFHLEMNGAAGLLRHGHLRSCRPDRRLHRLGQRRRRGNEGRHHAHGLDRADPHFLRAAGHSLPADQSGLPEARLGKGRRYEAAAHLIITEASHPGLVLHDLTHPGKPGRCDLGDLPAAKGILRRRYAVVQRIGVHDSSLLLVKNSQWFPYRIFASSESLSRISVLSPPASDTFSASRLRM